MNKSFFLITILSFGLSINLVASIPSGNIVLQLTFNDSIIDQGPNQYNLIVHGTNHTINRWGEPNKALSFNGINEYIEVKGLSDTVFTNDYTISIIGLFNNFFKDYPHIISGENGYINLHGTGPIYQDKMSRIGFHQGPNNEPENRRVPSFISDNSIDAKAFNQITMVKKGDTVSLYMNGKFDSYILANNQIPLPQGDNFYIGTGFLRADYQCFDGVIDYLTVYNRALSSTEIIDMQSELMCRETTFNDTTTFYVSNVEFEEFSPRIEPIKTDTLITEMGCLKINNRFAKYVYEPNHCTETIVDTIIITDTVKVTGTLEIEINVNNIENPLFAKIAIYPNPTKQYIIVKTDDFDLTRNYSFRITNSLGKVIYLSQFNQTETKINIGEFGQQGIYIIDIIDDAGYIKESRKLLVK